MTSSTHNSDLIRELESLIIDHPLFQDAKSKPHCEASQLLLFGADEIKGFRIDQKAKNVLLNVVKAPERGIRTLILTTADQLPEHFRGAGEHYTFFFHPEKPQLLHTDVGTWKS